MIYYAIRRKEDGGIVSGTDFRYRPYHQISVCSLGEELYQLYNRYGRGRITIEQFMALYLENKLDDYIEKRKKEIRGEAE